MDSKLSDFQKKVEEIENVILCVAEVENLISGMGQNMISPEQLARLEERHKNARFSLRPPYRGNSRSFVGLLSDSSS